MKPILLEDVIKAVNGVINKNINTDNLYIKNVSTDTRNINKGDLFIPIVGENFDGHNFINDAIKSGAICSLSDRDIDTDGIVIKVADTRMALKDLAAYYLSLFDVKVIALTGSAGKTTTKDMIATCLSEKYNTLKTEGNFNNEIGLPLTVFRVTDETEVVVLEMGMNHFGEIRELSKIAKPDIALITNIGFAHVENLGSRDGVFRAKYEIFDFMKPNGIKIFNEDDDVLKTLKDNELLGKTSKKYFYSIENHSDTFSINIDESNINNIKATIHFFDNSFDVVLNTSGKHMLSNALAATLVSHKMGLNAEQIKAGLEKFSPSKMRMDIIKANNYTIINDTYNANPSSMKASLDVLSKADGRKVAILGDMFELGRYSSELHYEVGKYAVEKNIDELIFVGEDSSHMVLGAEDGITTLSNKNINYFKSQDELLAYIDSLLKDGDTILVKASRGMKLENTVEKIMR